MPDETVFEDDADEEAAARNRVLADLGAVRQYGQAHPGAWVSATMESGPPARVVAYIWGDDFSDCESALRRLVADPARLQVNRAPCSRSRLDEIQAELLPLMMANAGSFTGIGIGLDAVSVGLRADQEVLAAEIRQRYGDAVHVTVSGLAAPLGRERTPPGSALQMSLSQPEVVRESAEDPLVAVHRSLSRRRRPGGLAALAGALAIGVAIVVGVSLTSTGASQRVVARPRLAAPTSTAVAVASTLAPTSTSAPIASGPPPTTVPPITAFHVCDPGQLHLAVATVGAGQDVAITVEPTSPQGAPCAFQAQVMLSLVDRSGRLLAVRGNPATKLLTGVVGATQADRPFPKSFSWVSACGLPNGPFRLQARLPWFGIEAAGTVSVLPCQGVELPPSSLQVAP